MGSVTVFGLPAQAETARVLTCLFEKDVQFELVRRDAYKTDNQRFPDFVKMQEPAGRVMLQDGDKTLLDSRDICRHICNKYARQGNRLLLGTGSLERAATESWIQKESHKFDPPSTTLVLHLAFAPLVCQPPDRAAVEEAEAKLSRVLDDYDCRLADSRYLAGDAYTLADLFHLPNAHHLATTPLGYDMLLERENVHRWWKEISARPHWRRVVDMQGEHPGVLQPK